MRRVVYGGSVFLTTAEIADELVKFAVDLANTGRAASIDVPGLSTDGLRSTFTLVLGPASQLVLYDLTDGHHLDGGDAAEKLRAMRLRTEVPPTALPFDTGMWDSALDVV